MVNKKSGKLNLLNIEGILLYDYLNNAYHVYNHVKGINPKYIMEFMDYPTILEAQTIGYVGEENGPAYGNSSPHIHFALFGGNIQYSVEIEERLIEISAGLEIPIWTLAGIPTGQGQLYPLGNPLNLLPDADLHDTDPLIFLNSEISGTQIDIVPNISNAGGTKFYTNGLIDKNHCPWQVRGKVDLIARINDYMNVRGSFAPHDANIFPGIYRINYQILEIPGSLKWLIDDSLSEANFNGLLPGGTNRGERYWRNAEIRPWISEARCYTDYDKRKYNYGYWVVSNTNGTGIHRDGCWDTSDPGISEGIYTIRITAYDHAGNSSFTDLNVEVRKADIYVDINNSQGIQNGTIEHPYRTLSQGIQNTSPGETIYVAPGTYNQNETFPIYIRKDGITIEGAGYESSIIEGNNDSSVFVITGYDVTIADLSVSCASYVVEPNFGAIIVDNGQASIKNCRIADNDSPGICLYWSYVETLISNCLIENNTSCGIYCDHAHDPANIVNCTISNNGIAGIAPELDSFTHISNCNIVNHSYAGVRATTGSSIWLYFCNFYNNPNLYSVDGTCSISSGNLFVYAPRFVSSGDRLFYLNSDADPGPDSQCIDAGNDFYVGDPAVYQQTTRSNNSLLPSGQYDAYPVDIGFHYYPVCYTPTPPPTPVIYSPTPCIAYTQPGAGWVDFDYEFYETENMTAKIGLTDSDLNSDPHSYETVDVTVTSDSDATGITFTLREESTNASRFTSTSNGQDLEFTTGVSVEGVSIEISDFDDVTVTYHDDTYSVDRTDIAIWYQNGAPTRTPTPTPTGTWNTSTPTSTSTPSPTPTGTWSTNTPIPTDTPTETPGGPTETPSATFTATSTPGPWTDTDAWGNTGTTITTFSWIDASSGTDLYITEDNGYATVSLPSSFDFYGNSYNSVNVSANGYMTFGNLPQEFENDYMPREIEPNDVIAPFFDDLNPADTGHVYYLDSGTYVTFEWDLFRHYRSWTDSYTFEVILYDDGQIKFQYYIMSGIYAGGESATIGIENSTGTIGLRYRDRFLAGEIFGSLAILFTPPSVTPIPTPTPETLYQNMNETAEENGEDWSLTGLWQVVDTSSGDPCAKAHGGTKSFWYGIDEVCNYDTGTENSGVLISPQIELAENITFTFWSWEEVEPNAYLDVADNRTVFITDDDGLTWDLVHFHEPDTTGWELHVVDIEAWEYKTVRIKFVFNTINDLDNDFPGWYVDDIVIESSVPPPIPALSTPGAFGLLILMGALILKLRNYVKKRHNNLLQKI
ncbi:right-handed parallel beta-helix repeat-containing protein [bacterium]|nr:right-handed parallel beta-helix repeat-containing protein [candidate division CSSED10-310 bacterium]